APAAPPARPAGPRPEVFMATATYVQAARPLTCTTPLGRDKLLAVGFSGTDALSSLFHYHLDVRAKNDEEVPFDKLLGQPVEFQIQGTFQPRDYVAQYRETDYNFASRLMEEEGIYYFFKFAEGGHTMVLANTPGSHPDVPGSAKVTYKTLSEAATQPEDFVY